MLKLVKIVHELKITRMCLYVIEYSDDEFQKKKKINEYVILVISITGCL